jgi:cell wall-associated NlpC family hydrolase
MSDVRDRIVAYARRNIGCRYSYVPSGGVEGESYNCSFLTTCAYRAAGLTIPRWQGHQNGDGSQSDWVWRSGHWTTDPDQLHPGDLVFFGTSRERTTHVGISLGGRWMIDSVPAGGVHTRLLYASFVGGGWPLKELPEDDTNDGRFPMQKTVTVRCERLAVRDRPSTSTGAVVAWYAKGDKVAIDGVEIGTDGYMWGHYVGASSKKDRYIALGSAELAR